MKSCYYWQSRGKERIARLEKHLEDYHDSIFDIPDYIVIFFYCLMYLISPKRQDKLKYEGELIDA